MHWPCRASLRASARPRKRQRQSPPLADEAEATVDRDVVLIAEDRSGQIDRRGRAVPFRFSLGELYRPAGITVLLAKFGRLLSCQSSGCGLP